MKITKKVLEKIIREELLKTLQEGEFGVGTESVPFSKENATENEKALYMRGSSFQQEVIRFSQHVLKYLDSFEEDIAALWKEVFEEEETVAGAPKL